MSSFHGLVEVLQAIAVPVDVEDMGFVEEPVKDRRRGFSRRLTSPRGRRYSSALVRRVNSEARAGIRRAGEKGKTNENDKIYFSIIYSFSIF
jgi:hypothetical protein